MEALKASSRSLEITVISSENIYVDGNPVTENAYVVIRTESINSYTTSMATARECGSYPSWNEKFLIHIPLHASSITFEVQCKMPTGAIRPIGVARIALSDLLPRGSVPENLQFLSYRLRNWDGRRNGIINFSVKVKTPEYSIPAMKPAKSMMMSSAKLEREVTCVYVGDKSSNRVAIGIPVQWSYPATVLACI